MKKYYLIRDKQEIHIGQNILLNGFDVKITEDFIKRNPNKFQIISDEFTGDKIEEEYHWIDNINNKYEDLSFDSLNDYPIKLKDVEYVKVIRKKNNNIDLEGGECYHKSYIKSLGFSDDTYLENSEFKLKKITEANYLEYLCYEFNFICLDYHNGDIQIHKNEEKIKMLTHTSNSKHYKISFGVFYINHIPIFNIKENKWKFKFEKYLTETDDNYKLFTGDEFYIVNKYYEIEKYLAHDENIEIYFEDYSYLYKFKIYQNALNHRIYKLEEDINNNTYEINDYVQTFKYYAIQHLSQVFNGDWELTEDNDKYIIMSDYTVDKITHTSITDVCFKSEEVAQKVVNLLKLL